MSFQGHSPELGSDTFVAPGAWLIGRVRLAARVCILFNAVIRGDTEEISIGEESNLQDGVVVHADPGFPASIGRGVSVGHNATVHGATVGDHCLIGMGATVLNGAVIGEGSLIAAGALVRQGDVIPPGSLVAGVPGVVRRPLTADEQTSIRDNASHYQRLRETYLSEL
jgi:carbonic anhydrase/acetyltransferase-like protein (isoleucine patch superfamily)